MLRRSVLAIFLAISTPLMAAADAVNDVIADQLGAFAERDVPRAWSHASPTIKGLFRSPDNFAAMVAQGYGAIWDNSSAIFTQRSEGAGRVRQIVIVTGADGRRQAYAYDLIETPDGWKIDGVQPVELDDLAV